MRNKVVGSTLLSIGVVTLACGLLAAQGVKLSPQMATTKGSPVIHVADAPPAGLKVLFGNLGSKTDAYDDTNGWLVEGPDNTNSFTSQAIGNPFSVSADSTLKGIRLALQFIGPGTNNAAVAIYTDNAGLPGKLLGKVDVNNLPAFGSCCDMVTIKDPKGFKLKAGVTYWLVAGTDKASKTAYNVWDYTFDDSQGPIAFEGTATGNVWEPYTGSNAFAIYGTTP